MLSASGGVCFVITVAQTAQQLMNSRNVLTGFSNSTKTFTKSPYFKHSVSKGSSTNRKRARLRHKAQAQQLLKIFKWCSTAEPQHSLTNRPPKHSSDTSSFPFLQCMRRIHQIVLCLLFILGWNMLRRTNWENLILSARMTSDWNAFTWTCLVIFFRHSEPTQTLAHQHIPALIRNALVATEEI